MILYSSKSNKWESEKSRRERELKCSQDGSCIGWDYIYFVVIAHNGYICNHEMQRAKPVPDRLFPNETEMVELVAFPGAMARPRW